jgi:hypothetical protein
MKTTILIASTLVVLTTATIAHAQPALTASVNPKPAATTYLEGGLAFGAIMHAGFYGAYTLEGGYQLGDGPLWIHAMGAYGGMAGIDETTMSSGYLALRAGVEARGCALHGQACVIGGVDAGFRSAQLQAEYDHYSGDTALVVARAGLDLGSKHVRLRPGLETTFAGQGFDGFGASMAVAYQW